MRINESVWFKAIHESKEEMQIFWMAFPLICWWSVHIGKCYTNRTNIGLQAIPQPNQQPNQEVLNNVRETKIKNQ